MEEYMMGYERIGEVTVMDGAQNEDMEIMSNKRRKVNSPGTIHSRPSNSQLEIERRRRAVNCSLSPAVSGISDHDVSSLCYSDDLCVHVKDSSRTSDLKEESFVTDISKLSKSGFSRETTPSSEAPVDSETMESSIPKTKKPAQASSRCKPAVSSKIPSAMEIEEFFSEAEKYEQKRFTDKYNYDIVKDVPLEGRYQWVKLKP